MHRIAVRIAGVVAALALAAAPSLADVWEREYQVSGTPSLEVRTNDGSIQVMPGSSGRVEVTVETRGWDIGPGEVEVRASQKGNRIEIEVREPRRWFSIGVSRRSIRTTVRVPASADVDLYSGDGAIAIEGVKGRIEARTSDGSIDATRLKGDLHLRSGDGRISGVGLDGTLVASTSDGRMQIDGRFDALSLRSGDGSIYAEAAKGSRMSDEWSVTTSDGRVQLKIPSTFAADLDIHTGDGSIDVDLPVSVEGRYSRSTLRGTLNGGGPVLRLRSGDGSIRLGRST